MHGEEFGMLIRCSRCRCDMGYRYTIRAEGCRGREESKRNISKIIDVGL